MVKNRVSIALFSLLILSASAMPTFARDDRRERHSCADAQDRRATGGVVGAIVGAIIGSNTANKEDRGIATLFGAMAGADVGADLADGGCSDGYVDNEDAYLRAFSYYSTLLSYTERHERYRYYRRHYRDHHYDHD